MDPDDEVLSDVHLYCKTTANGTQGKYKLLKSRFLFKIPKKAVEDVIPTEILSSEQVPFVTGLDEHKCPVVSSSSDSEGLVLDEDGDVVVSRHKDIEEEQDVIYIEHAMATKLSDVGLQVWRGALLLCDFILSQRSEFIDKVVLELGSGAGLASILLSAVAQTVYATDTGDEVLALCKKNCELNKNISCHQNAINVRELDWFEDNFCQDPKNPFHWLAEDICRLKRNIILVAADVIYDEDLTEAFFRRVHRIMSVPPRKKLYISLEKRLNFTLSDLDVACPAYDHFQQCLSELTVFREDNGVTYTVEQVPSTFPQYFKYDRTKYLELWLITSSFEK
ncbi:methyltransferase-like protein 22 [Lingula anatina]|uniref:Methyltransferase-like protein 22 n=1 Tax=Lingula anatina TaxID=7574 RepID=A0A1S3JZR0_LINAN|nr:methyltransferase-like protein 22 [Lingula anatina]XP_013415586.1 methyltransferase-like protein 22 [Lingula anatina]XP_013415589.1 methyltransferase-like protein 22 [Lingula anatina]|eukprot:XP_013415585.1 methyltransferase-like protein 22 [Lingula anatina]